MTKHKIGNQVGPFAATPVWIFDPELYLPGVPDATKLVPGDEKPLTGAELRVFIALKSFANGEGHCYPHVQTLADRAKVTHRMTEKALSKFKRLGWVVAERKYRREDGKVWITGCEYWVIDVCPSPVPGRATGGSRPSGRGGTEQLDGRGPVELDGAKNEPYELTNRTPDLIGLNSVERAVEPKNSTTHDDYRPEDKELFRSLTGDRLRSDGTRWAEGEWDVDRFYDAYRKSGMRWPGRYLDKIACDGESGVDTWMMTEGLEIAEVAGIRPREFATTSGGSTDDPWD